MSRTICPQCGFEQKGGAECLRCGIVFERYLARQEALRNPAGHSYQSRGSRGGFRRYYRIFRWFMLASLIPILFLIFLRAPEPEIITTPAATLRAEEKIRRHQSTTNAGRAHRLELDQPELNGWLGSRLALAPKEIEEIEIPDLSADSPAAVEQMQSNVKDVKIELLEDQLRAHVVFDFHGLDLTLVLKGKLFVQNGYLRFQPTSGKLGRLPLPEASLRSAMTRLFDSPQNKEKFRLPPEISDVGVKRGKLYLSAF